MIDVAIVGNGPIPEAQLELIARMPVITRFNQPRAAHLAKGAATTELVLSVSAKQVGEFLSSGQWRDDPAFQAAERIVTPFHPAVIRAYGTAPSLLSRLKGRRADWTDLCAAICAEAGKPMEVLDPAAYHRACATLGITPGRDRLFPSAGFMAVQRALDIYPATTHAITLFGFGFQGWKRHDWAAEARVVRGWRDDGVLRLQPVVSD